MKLVEQYNDCGTISPYIMLMTFAAAHTIGRARPGSSKPRR